MVSFSVSSDTTPRGSHPARSAGGRCRRGVRRLSTINRQDPGPIGGSPPAYRNVAPAARSAVLAGRPALSTTPSKLRPAECATMNQGGTPDASSAPIIDPAEVPTMRSALAGSQPVSVASASSPPVSQAPPITPPAPSTRPTLGEPPILYSSVPVQSSRLGGR